MQKQGVLHCNSLTLCEIYFLSGLVTQSANTLTFQNTCRTTMYYNVQNVSPKDQTCLWKLSSLRALNSIMAFILKSSGILPGSPSSSLMRCTIRAWILKENCTDILTSVAAQTQSFTNVDWYFLLCTYNNTSFTCFLFLLR